MIRLFIDLASRVRHCSILLMLCAGFSTTPALAGVSTPEASGDPTNTYVLYKTTYSGTPSYVRVYIDTDRDATSGFAVEQLGADYLIENTKLYRYAGAGEWKWAFIKNVAHSNAEGVATWNLARADIGSPTVVDLVAQSQAPKESSAKVSRILLDTQEVTYEPSTALFTNPERGLYRHSGDCDRHAFDLSTLQRYRLNEDVSLVMCIFYLKNFADAPILQNTLDFFQQQMSIVRAAGLKAIVRFAYTADETGIDANPTQLAKHLDQLAPYLSANTDVIYVVQAGFVGAWGEWHYTRNYGNKGTVSPTDWANRKAVVDKLLQIVPPQRMVQLRTPRFKRIMYSGDALLSSQAFGGSTISRIGHHNDCFLASTRDMGTYTNTSIEYPYLAAETTYLPMGGEACVVNPPRSECFTALEELKRFHWSYLNRDHGQVVLNSWNTGGCFDEIKQKLGYRFSLHAGSYTASARPGSAFKLNIALQNDGWAAPFNARHVELILRHTTSGALYRFPLETDPRHWLPGQLITLNQSTVLPASMPVGTYSVLLNLPDAAATLSSRPEYSIQLANVGMWEETTGFNNLQHTVTIAP